MLFILPPFYFNALMSLFDFKIIVNSWFLNAMKKQEFTKVLLRQD